MPPRSLGGMTVRKACATLNFPNPPTAAKDLKKRFITLAKTHHPDLQETEEGKMKATERMANITEAYKLLKSLIENRTAGGRIGGGGSSTGKDKAGQSAAWERDAAGMNFTAPGIAKSSGDMWLPWQKAAPSRVVDTEKVLEESKDFWSFKASVRRRENRAAAAEEHAWSSSSPSSSNADSHQKETSQASNAADHNGNSSDNNGSSSGTSSNTQSATDSSSKKMDGSSDTTSSTKGVGGNRDYSRSQYSADHFKRQKNMSDKIKGNSKRASSIDLLTSYLRARAPSRILESIRYIITGR